MQTDILGLKYRILILDGAMGTMIQTLNLTENDFRGDRFANHTKNLRGCNDVLCLTRPGDIRDIHSQYICSGADIISTNSFNANRFSLADYGLETFVPEINSAAARLAREAADSFMEANPERKIYVAGSVGPTNRTSSMSPDVNDPSRRDVTYGMLRMAYRDQIRALISSGADMLLIETVFDTLNAKAALHAAEDVKMLLGHDFPIMLSVTITEKGARTFSGQTLEAFIASVSHAPLASLGLNCSFGPEEMLPVLRLLSRISPFPVSAHPNAGLPDESGRYSETPSRFANAIGSFAAERLVNIVGGCCGTTPDHIRLLPRIAHSALPHIPQRVNAGNLTLSGLSALRIDDNTPFVNIGERCNVAGSRKFLRLIKEKNYDEAVGIALKQIHDGADIIDINMDDPMLDAPAEMTHFLNLVASEPEIAKVPVMIDSSDWKTVKAGLEAIQGKGVVNSISLKEGEETFLRKAREIRNYGAAIVVMAFDEQGQADTYNRKIQVCERAYRLLVEKAAIPPTDIIFDPNILTVATGIEAHDRYAIDFIEATRWIKSNLPGAKVSGGVSNLSFSFRGNTPLRNAIHSVFLHHAYLAGMDMAILNPAAIPPFNSIDPELRMLIEDVLLCRTDSGLAVERLIGYASKMGTAETAAPKPATAIDRREIPLTDRLANAIINGSNEFLQADIDEALETSENPADIINGPLMAGMNRIGELFGEGKMFLPQVVKSARTMKRAVQLLKPALTAGKSEKASAGKILFATVRGDVHDIGKNIVSIVLSCNNFEVIDLGVMVEPETILKAAQSQKPDFICLSGLITPSLSEMAVVIEMLARNGIDTPVMVGGAATSRLHTALKLAPLTPAPVIYASDAARNPILAARYLNASSRPQFLEGLEKEYDSLRRAHTDKETIPLAEARAKRFCIPRDSYIPVPPSEGTGLHIVTLPAEEIKSYINRRALLHAWRLSAAPESLEALTLLADAERLFDCIAESHPGFCRASFRIMPSGADGDDLILADGIRLPMLRSQHLSDGHTLSIADFVMPVHGAELPDFTGLFAVNGAFGLEALKDFLASDDYQSLLLSTLCDRIAEAGAELLHTLVRRRYWGYAPEETLPVNEIMQGRYSGIRPAIGFPSIPDQLMNFILNRALKLDRIGIKLTVNGAMSPASSVSGLMIASPAARYFSVGIVSDEQLRDYASRRDIPIERLRDIIL